MIIVHENLIKEASRIAERLRDVYGFDSKLVDRDLTLAFTQIPEFDGFAESSQQLREFLSDYGDKKVLIITPKDIYADKVSQDDDWVFGFWSWNITLASTARMKRLDNKPSSTLEIPEEQYMKRLELLAIHEIGHDVVRGPHFQTAKWVNDKTGHELWLGPHCTDNKCVMYEVVDIRAPPKEEGHMRLGDEKRYDAGLDDVLGRLYPGWFCDRCKPLIKIDEGYR